MSQPPSFPPEAWKAIQHSGGYMNELADLRAEAAGEATEGPLCLCALITLIVGGTWVYGVWYGETEVEAVRETLFTALGLAAFFAGLNTWYLAFIGASLKRRERALREKWMRLKGFAPVPPAADED